MNKKILWCVLFFITFAANLLWAAPQSLNLNWNISDTTNISGYKMYWSHDAGMTTKNLACANYNNPATTNSLECNNVEIDSYPYYVAIAAVFSDGSPELVSAPEKIVAPIATVENLRVVLSQ